MSNFECAFCKQAKLPGILFPTEFDDRSLCRDGKVFIAACIECGIYATDVDAAEVVSKATGWLIKKSYDTSDSTDAEMREQALSYGPHWFRPYFAVTLKEAEDVIGRKA